MTTIYVGNLPFSATETDVRSLFEKHGTVQSVKLVNDRETGRPRGFGFVEMPPSDAQTARRVNPAAGNSLGGPAGTRPGRRLAIETVAPTRVARPGRFIILIWAA